VQCVILAGGLGTRMAAIAAGIPKVLIPVCGRPFAHHQIELLANHGVRELVYCVGYKAAAIREALGSGHRWGVSICYVDEGEKLRGTAGALRLALDSGALAAKFFVLYGDSYLPIDYRAVWQAFERLPDDQCLMTVFRNEQRWDASNVQFDGSRVRLYDKTPRDPESASMAYIDYGLTAMPASTVADCVGQDTRADLADVYRRLSLAGSLAGYEVFERFYEIGSESGLRDLQAFLEGNTDAR
jgi:NDP-sugar pyrophosphorylase family protein